MKIKIVVAALAAALAVSPAAASKPQDDSYEKLKLLVDVLGLVQDNYVDEAETQKLVYGAATGLVRTLDPYSQFMDPESHREMKTETEGQFGGVGLRMTVKDEVLTVLTPMPGSPAYRLGILPNDRLSAIEGVPTRDMSLADALRKLRGAPGTKVKVTIERGPDEEPAAPDRAPAKPRDAKKAREIEITRELVKIDSVQSLKLDGGVACVRVAEFSAKTAEDVESSLARLRKEGANSFILDLRNNPGGLLSAGVETASLFLGDGKLIVYTQGRRTDSRQDFNAAAKAAYGDAPLVVLINEGSASAAEIVAGALQDHARAVVVGQRSFGKASVQSLIPLSDGSGLRLTVARYYTPKGRSIHRDEKAKTGGIEPDIAVPVEPDTEAKLYAQWELIYAKDRKPRSAVKAEEMVRDEVLDRAVELLRARAVLGTLNKKEG